MSENTLSLAFGVERMDFARIAALLSDTYWWKSGIDAALARHIAERSAVVAGLWDGPRQVAYARVISDGVTLAYLADVVVEEGYRGQGAGRRLVHAVLEHPDVRDVRKWLLFTNDAQSFYAKEGFGPLPFPERCLLRPV